jgi:diguanylate cyclase (GGDEF)-like protein
MFKEMLQMSYLTFVADITLILFILYNSTLSKKRKSVFLCSSLISLVMTVCNIVVYSLDNKPDHLTALKVFSALSYCISGPVVLPFVFLTGVIAKRIRMILYSAATLNVVLCISSIWTGWIFSYDSEGKQSLGWLAPIPFIFSGMYLMMLLAASLLKFRLGFRHESMFIFVLSLAIISAVILNTFFHYRFLISGMAVLSCTFYYMFFGTQTLTRDAMTNAFNRHSFYKDIEYMKKRRMYIISLDLNGLKQINDTLGHDAGDKAISTVAECAMDVLPMRCRFYRMGGDEFEILYPDAEEAEVEKVMNRLKDEVESRDYSVAIGWSEYHKGMDFDEAFRKADSIMYYNKAKIKAEKLKT